MTDEQFANLTKQLESMGSRLDAVEKLMNAHQEATLQDSDMPDEKMGDDDMMKEFENLQKLFQGGLISSDEYSTLLTELESVANLCEV